MALIQDFTDSCGNTYASCYWRLDNISISPRFHRAHLIYSAFKDATAFTEGKEPVLSGKKDYTITGAEFASLASAAPVGASLFLCFANAADAYALGCQDVDSGEKDQDGNPIMVSYFAGATQV